VLIPTSPAPAAARCRWCHAVLPDGRRTLCGPACARRFRRYGCSRAERRAAFARDKGVCRVCGRDACALAHNLSCRKVAVLNRHRLHRLRRQAEGRVLPPFDPETWWKALLTRLAGREAARRQGRNLWDVAAGPQGPATCCLRCAGRA
jgi:hypothetical protein